MKTKLPKEIKILDVWRSSKPIIVVYALEKTFKNNLYMIAYTSESWKECLELVTSKESFEVCETEMLKRINNHFYFGKKLKEIIV